MREKCAVLGIRSTQNVFDSIYYGLYSLQHRGQESAGLAVYNNNEIDVHKDMGLVSSVFENVFLEGKVGIGHVRYSTQGDTRIENSQPITIGYGGGSLAIAHNGHLVNGVELKEKLKKKGAVFTTDTDTEVIAHLIAQEHMKTGDFVNGVGKAMKKMRGSYSLTLLKDDRIIAVRDPNGFRPLVYGRNGNQEVVASESCALDSLGVPFVRDVKAGEILVLGDKIESIRKTRDKASVCMFEYVYFARADSVIDGISVYKVRKNLGENLYRAAPVKADLVTAVPDSGITAAIGYARASGIPYGESLIKNRYLGRTFIMPRQEERERGVRIKLNPIKSEIEGKRIILIDDSIVRGTTIKKLIDQLRNAGALEVHVRISCPPILNPCFYGIDMQTSDEFIARKFRVDEIRKEIGADSLVYNNIEDLVDAIGLPRERMCMACLNGEYPLEEEQKKLVS
ncbi:MAG: amidophosphoribosyltransferase [Candidatus Altiarchaeales archaeon ex4484_2]|nr:MAG: amidophosphoribosyltransferase [Candidatus Altiarchaeales archaeon ex4484_2]